MTGRGAATLTGRLREAAPSTHRPDPRIARAVAAQLGAARTVLNVVAPDGSPRPRPSAHPTHPPHPLPSVTAVAGELPFPDRSFDAAMALLTVHQWEDPALGLREMRRVTRGPVLVLTRDPARARDFWLRGYAPEVVEAEARRYPPPHRLAAALGGSCTVRPIPIPLDCTDGFDEACYGRPELLLDPNSRRADWTWSSVGDGVRERFDRMLRRDLASGAWDRRFGHLRGQPEYEGALVLVRATP